MLQKISNRVLQKISVHKMKKVKSGLRKVHNEELRNMNSIENNIRMITSRRMRWWDM